MCAYGEDIAPSDITLILWPNSLAKTVGYSDADLSQFSVQASILHTEPMTESNCLPRPMCEM